ncbi:hypothetical protein LTR16_011571, partial [Cryomyces antarcticus]
SQSRTFAAPNRTHWRTLRTLPVVVKNSDHACEKSAKKSTGSLSATLELVRWPSTTLQF